MRISMLTCGTRGDTQPLMALGAELRRRGHDVRLAVSPNTMAPARACGFETLPFGPDSQALMESENGQRWLAAGDVKTFVKELTAASQASFETSRREAEVACAGAELIVAGLLAEDFADAFAELHGVPLVTLHHAPVRRTRRYPHPLVSTARLPGPVNALTGALFDRVWWAGSKTEVQTIRADAGLPPAKGPLAARRARSGALELQAYDQALVPDLEWGARRPLVGFLNPDDELRRELGESGLDAELTAWLDAGEPPVFLGFGSMPVRDPAATVAMITGVATRLGVRALVSAGWGGLSALDPDDPDVVVVGNVDHVTVLPRCVAAVHHGGAGTTATSLGAGVPTVVCSVFADQPFWGARVERQGLGAHVRFAELDGDTLEAALSIALDDAVRSRVGQLALRLRGPREAAVAAADEIETRL